ncbi:MAG: YbhB/YbcL family Raf kinase inhibitor-like protein [Planctomycetota bacterium]|nr:YbhB/YbcL family Raf kinase inhibitor-like protein [Planctomycetota bacterium]
MLLRSDSFADGDPIPAAFAFAKPHPESHVTLSDNRSPQLTWSEVPEGSASFVVTCIDDDVPTVGDDVNVEGRSVPADLPRTEFVHWLLVDVPATQTELAAGACSEGVTAGGKSDPAGPAGSRQGVNDFTGWFAGDVDMGGTYLGYDGPAPPWNDERLHHYHFEVIALDVERLDLPEGFDIAQLRAALAGHELARARLTGTYTQNPALA